MIYLAGGEKGGGGKTTIAVHLAAMLAREGRDVLLLDADVSGDAAGWVALRNELHPSAPTIYSARQYGKVAPTIRDMARRYQDVVVDAGGRDSTELRSAMTAANVCVLPARASQFDLWALGRMAGILGEARITNPGLRAFVVFNQASNNWTNAEAEQAREALRALSQFVLTETVWHERKAFRACITAGQSVLEIGRAAEKAAEEVAALMAELGITGQGAT